MRTLVTIIFLITVSSAWGLNLDPNKRTVCSMTLNSDEERDIFIREVEKDRAHFNQVVELTSFGSGGNWFEAACRTGVRCDILVISGHFTDRFSGNHQGARRSLTMDTMERAGCRNTCEGIMDHPYEVFLLGCNTLSEKGTDTRGERGYLEHLLEEGTSRSRSELVTEGLFGITGDSNRGRMERAFRGQTKMLYGFDSRGPSGATIEPMLNDYFRRRSLLAGLQRAEAVRATSQVTAANNLLAETLNRTAFEQCVAGADSLLDRRVCALYNEGLTVERRLSIIEDAFGEEDWIKYVPTINEFLRAHPPANMSREQRNLLRELARNPVIGRQARNLARSHRYAAVRAEWQFFADSIGFGASGAAPERRADPIGDLIEERESLIDEHFLDGI